VERSLAYIRTDTAKMILDLERPDHIEVYDLRYDPGEQTDVAGHNTAADDALRQQLMAWRHLQAGSDGLAQKITPTREQIEALRSLGYVQ
jgi:arylsulfatase A-like enzyme